MDPTLLAAWHLSCVTISVFFASRAHTWVPLHPRLALIGAFLVASCILAEHLVAFLALGADWTGSDTQSGSFFCGIYWSGSFHTWNDLVGMVGSASFTLGYLGTLKMREASKDSRKIY
jgi:hypothetical protein